MFLSLLFVSVACSVLRIWIFTPRLCVALSGADQFVVFWTPSSCIFYCILSVFGVFSIVIYCEGYCDTLSFVYCEAIVILLRLL